MCLCVGGSGKVMGQVLDLYSAAGVSPGTLSVRTCAPDPILPAPSNLPSSSPPPLFPPSLPPCSGADRAALNADGKTALEVAQLNEQEDVIKALS